MRSAGLDLRSEVCGLPPEVFFDLVDLVSDLAGGRVRLRLQVIERDPQRFLELARLRDQRLGLLLDSHRVSLRVAGSVCALGVIMDREFLVAFAEASVE